MKEVTLCSKCRCGEMSATCDCLCHSGYTPLLDVVNRVGGWNEFEEVAKKVMEKRAEALNQSLEEYLN